MSALLELLRQAPIFAGLGERDLRACADRFHTVRFAQDQALFSRHDPGDRLLLVEEGRVRLAVMTEDGRELSVRHAVHGELLGEIAVLDGGPRTADAVALTPVLAQSLGRADLEALLSDQPMLGRAFITFLCGRLRQTTDQLEGIALYPIEVRLARFLLTALGGRRAEPGKRVPLEITFSQSELAQLLGASRPKINGALAALAESGAIRRTSDRLFCDPDALARRAALSDG